MSRRWGLGVAEAPRGLHPRLRGWPALLPLLLCFCPGSWWEGWDPLCRPSSPPHCPSLRSGCWRMAPVLVWKLAQLQAPVLPTATPPQHSCWALH